MIRIVRCQQTDSTNEECRRRIRAGVLSPGDAVTAPVQTSGRGSRGRSWDSPPGGLYLSWYRGAPPAGLALQCATLAAGLAALGTLRERGVDATLKWPNDLRLGDRKIGGILAENMAWNGENHLILGVGINLLQGDESFRGRDYLAGSVFSLRGLRLEPETLAEPLLAHLVRWFSLLEEDPVQVLEAVFPVLSEGERQGRAFCEEILGKDSGPSC